MLKGLNKQRGGALIGIIFVVVLVAAIYFGSSFFLKEEVPSEKSLKLLQEAQERAAMINQDTEEKNEMLEDLVGDTEEKTEETQEESNKEEVVITEKDLDTSIWQELVRENENFQVKFHKNWYFTVNRREAAQDGYSMIIGFEEDPNIWEKLPPFAVELVISSENMNWDYDGYKKEVGSLNGMKYTLRTEDKDTYGEVLEQMATTFEFINQ